MIAEPSPVMRTSAVAGIVWPPSSMVPSQLPTSASSFFHSGVWGTTDIFMASGLS